MSDISFRPLTADEIEVRVQNATEKGVVLLLYKDARCDMRILDEVIGADRWDCSYDRIGDGLFCKVGIFNEATGWVYKQDIGVPSNMESAKGEASDAFKRACFKWGIGRELYTAPYIYIPSGDCRISRNSKGKPACYDRFSVASIEVEDGHITDITIRNDSLGRIVWPKGAGNTTSDDVKRTRFIKRIEELHEQAISLGVKPEALNAYSSAKHGKPISELTLEQLEDVGNHCKQLIADMEALNGPAD